MRNTLPLSAAAFATVFLSAATAFAVPIGSTNFSPAATSPAYNYANPTVMTVGTLTSINFSGAPPSTNSVSPTNGNGSVNVFYTLPGDVFTTSGSGILYVTGGTLGFKFSDSAGVIGTFTQTSAAVNVQSYLNGQFASQTYDVEGTVSGGTAESGGQVLAASVTISLTQTGGAGSAVSFSGTIATPSTFVPEPASLAILGAGLFGVGFIRRRRA